jgi:uncharacterized protein YdhG (YjbR/CyaY superfamily)
MKARFQSVDEYIARQPAAAQSALSIVRATIRHALPDATEVISYNMPTYRRHGVAVLYFAGWKQHYSLYPVGDRLIAEFKHELASCTIEKHTLRFSLSEPAPADLIENIAKFRAQEVADRGETKNGARRRSGG